MKQRFQIEELKESDGELWDEWLLKLPYSSPFSTSWWLRAVCDMFGGVPEVFVVKKNIDTIVGGIGLRKVKVFKKSVVTPSKLSLYMPTVISEEISYKERVEIEKELGIFLKDKYNVILNITNTKELYDIRAFQWLNYDIKVGYTALLDLKNFGLSSIDRSERKQIKKAEREGMFTEPCDDMELMYGLWIKTFERQNLSMPVSLSQIRYLYNAIKTQKAGQGFVTFTRNREPASFRICIWNNFNIVYDWIAGSDPVYFRFGAPAFNLWSTLQYLKGKGFSTFDFCGANIESIANFKLSFGAKLIHYYNLQHIPLWFKFVYPLRKIPKKFLRKEFY